MKFVLVSLLLVAAVAAERFYYEGYKVYDMYPSSIEEVDFLHELMLTDDNLDFWEEPNRMGGKVTVMVAPEHQSTFVGAVQAENLIMSIRHEDLGEHVKQFWEDYDTRRSQRAPGILIDFDDFNTLEEIEEWMYSLESSECAAQGLFCEVRNIGSTYEGRDILSLRLVSEYGVDSTVTRLVDTYDWYFVPVFNPDGYKYTHDNARYWRKNRSPVSSTCYGVDLNRNHDYNWGEEGVSHSPCSDLYCGESGASELETQAVQDEITRVNGLSGIQVLMTFHSYGNMWMHPWGNTINFNGVTCERADDHDDMYSLAVVTADAIQATHNTRWSRGTSCEVIYETTGGTDDWAKGVEGVKYTICPELRGNDFVVLPSQIALSFQEIWNGLVAQEAELNVRQN
ncbi:hypothetical protein CAPTEDRAFT_222664 [Capitella teleta]|uniref:Peptidase M14 domain-containing protein n=1 Tax=Capitella teleta TaxID=283909 RepID=R7UZV7_CAPTE|nr:hypothetical protein CAPTEDRAFT_222664 [Capitella teleta]|eukprot:ELU08971.1 hypothetical protein CAPTEDRAFT_222664 [Capitella teleta]